jgi:hypothetical protein
VVQVHDTTTARPTLTLSEAVQACGVSRATLKRRLGAGELPGAYKDDEGSWRLPVDVLLAAGFRLHRPDPVHEPVPAQGHAPGLVDELRDRVARLTAELADARARAEERERALSTLELALRALGPGPAVSAPQLGAIPKRRWWHRDRPPVVNHPSDLG